MDTVLRELADRPVLTVLAGVNGAGKSSVGGEGLRRLGAAYFNPDELARVLREVKSLSQSEANAQAWIYGKTQLEDAIRLGKDFTFETTLGGKSITQLLIQAAKSTHRLEMWFVGLESVELHLERIAQRVSKGGHPIPEADVRRRWVSSVENLIRMLPYVHTLRVFDNSAPPAENKKIEPKLVLSIQSCDLVYPPPERLEDTPAWAKPVVMAAYRLFRLID